MATTKYTKRNKSSLIEHSVGDWLKDSVSNVGEFTHLNKPVDWLGEKIGDKARKGIKKVANTATSVVGDYITYGADTALGLFGAGNVIQNDKYDTKAFGKISDITSKYIAPAVGMVAANALAPGIGGAILGGTQQVAKNAVGDPLEEKKLAELSAKQEREALIAQKNMDLSVPVSSNIPTFRRGGRLGEISVKKNRSIKGSLVAGLQDRYNSTKNKNQKDTYLKMLQHLNTLKYNSEEGREEWEIYANDPVLKDYINDPTTKGLMYNRGFNTLDLEEPEMPKKLINGGYIIDYKGKSHEEGGIPVDAVTGKAIPRQFASNEVEDKEVGVKFPGEETPYIFSDKLGFSDIARKIVNKYSKRKNDSTSKNVMFKELGGLMKEQEEVRNKKLKYHTDKIKKFGGTLKYSGLDLHPMTLNNNTEASNEYKLTTKLNPIFGYNRDVSLDTSNINSNVSSLNNATEDYSPYHGSYLPGAINIAGNIAGAIGSNKARKKNKFEYSPDINPELVDLSDTREMIKEKADTRFNTLKSSIKSLSPQQQAAVLASYSNTDEFGALRESYLNEQSYNADTKNRLRMYNMEKRMKERAAKREQDEMYRQEKQKYINNIFNTVSSLATQGQNYDVLNMLSDNYMIGQDPNANLFQKFAGTKPKYRVKN